MTCYIQTYIYTKIMRGYISPKGSAGNSGDTKLQAWNADHKKITGIYEREKEGN
jgi:hypothetical protein